MFWTSAQIAEATGLTQRHIGTLLNAGKIAGYKAGHDWIIQEDEAKRFVEEYNRGKSKTESQTEQQPD